MMAERDDPTPPYDSTFLLDLAQSLGRIEGQQGLIIQEQGRAAEGRKAQYEALEDIRARADAVDHKMDALKVRLTALEPDVAKMKNFRAQLAVAVFVVTSVVTGAINLVWIGISNLSHIKEALREFLR